MLGWSGFLINSHDPLRGHVLKHIRQNSLTSLRYSVAEQGNEKQKVWCALCARFFVVRVAHATLADRQQHYALVILTYGGMIGRTGKSSESKELWI